MVISSGEVWLRNTVDWCGESTASSGCSLETVGEFGADLRLTARIWRNQEGR